MTVVYRCRVWLLTHRVWKLQVAHWVMVLNCSRRMPRTETEKSDAFVYNLLSDGELNEGSTWEAVMSASHWN